QKISCFWHKPRFCSDSFDRLDANTGHSAGGRWEMSIIRSRTPGGWRAAAVAARLCAALAALLCAALALPGAALAAPSSLPAKLGTAPQPGPPILYQPPASAPALENAPGSIWHAAPILV